MVYNKVLLHVCCANCVLYPWGQFEGEGMALTGYFFNPNIHPYQEHRRRLMALEGLSEGQGWEILYEEGYDLEGFMRQVVFREKERCRHCYRMRLDATARLARRGDFGGFSTTLLYSRYQAHDLIREVGEDVAQKHEISFIYRDFRTGWEEGVRKSRELGLYRQKYCGCIFSEKERYFRPKS